MRQSAWLPPKSVFACSGILAIALSLPSHVQAQQVVSDGILNTNVTRSLNDFTITDGARSNSGTNLFHSFSEFSIPTGGSAFFDNAADVANIFSRVTGGSVSSIDGLIRANGNANLFLLNPNGIIFGANARLNIGGSFVGTTAQAIKFAEGAEFSAINPTSVPLLTMSVPIGLQMGQSSGSITAQGTGHNILRSNVFTPASLAAVPLGLNVSPGHTLALIGNSITLTGSILSAPSGQIELGSLSGGQVELLPSPQGWQFDYSNASGLRDIALSQAALINASGAPGGSIYLSGQNIKLYDSSIALVQNQGTQDAGQISVQAAGLLEMRGSFSRDPAGIVSETVGTGAGVNVSISAHQIRLSDGARIRSDNFIAGGKGGDISVQVSNEIELVGESSFDPTQPSIIAASGNFGGGQGGSLTITASQLLLRDGGAITTAVGGAAKGGNLYVKADRIDLIGESTVGTSSAISAPTIFGGDAGQLQVDTKQLLIQAGGSISSSTLSSGNAGNLVINATDSIVLSGRGRLSGSSRIVASGEIVNPVFQKAIGLSLQPTGDASNIQINTAHLEVRDGASILAGHAGTGTTGTLKINANNIRLDAGNISTSTKSGQGGDIDLTIAQGLFLRQGSVINATAGGAGNGGNVLINSPIILGLENSDIIANAERGIGGNIEITTQGIIGLQFQNTLNPRLNLTNDITASSELNVNGTVQINNIGVDPNTGLIELASEPVDASQKVAEGCQSVQRSSSFIISGRGGIPEDPNRGGSGRSWHDLRALATAQTRDIAPPTRSATLVEATSWQRNAQTSKVELVAAVAPRSPQVVTCQPKVMTSKSTQN